MSCVPPLATRSMSLAVITLTTAILAAMSSDGRADVVVRVAQVAPEGAIVIPDAATFAVTMESDSGARLIAGLDMRVVLGDASAGGGVLTAGSSSLFAEGGFFSSDFQPPGTGLSAEYAALSLDGVSIGSSPVRVATVTLATTGSATMPGTYSIALAALLVSELGPGGVPVAIPAGQVTGIPADYTLAAVPEPGTATLAAVAVLGLAVGRRGRPAA